MTTDCSLISSGSSCGRPVLPYSDSLASSVSENQNKEEWSLLTLMWSFQN